jgi:hypothetical protein
MERDLLLAGRRPMQQSALDERHLNRNGRISREHGNTLISSLRMIYGPAFARGMNPDAKLEDVIHKMDEPSLSLLERDLRAAG